MDLQLKQRLVGAAVLVVLAVIFLPMLLEEPHYESSELLESPIPPKPDALVQAPLPMSPPNDLPAEPKISEEGASVPQSVLTPARSPLSQEPAGVEPNQGSDENPLQAWVIQVASFRQESNAIALRDRLRTDGYTTFVESTTVGGKPLFRVRIGPELDRQGAERIRDEVEKSLELNALIFSYP